MTAVRAWLSSTLVSAAAWLTRRRHPDWADAMLSEHASLDDPSDQLGWAVGSLRASLIATPLYPLLLLLAVAAMALYQWSADENVVTLAMMGALSVLLGGLRPARYVVSGLALGVVVASVNAFETLTGIRPSYEIHRHTWLHDLGWAWLALPALGASALGRRLASSAHAPL